MRIHPFDDLPVSLSRGGPQPGQESCRTVAEGYLREPHPDMVADARLAGRVQHSVCVLWKENARLYPDARPQRKRPPRTQELLESVEHIEVNDSRDGQRFPPRQPRNPRRRVSLHVV